MGYIKVDIPSRSSFTVIFRCRFNLFLLFFFSFLWRSAVKHDNYYKHYWHPYLYLHLYLSDLLYKAPSLILQSPAPWSCLKQDSLKKYDHLLTYLLYTYLLYKAPSLVQLLQSPAPWSSLKQDPLKKYDHYYSTEHRLLGSDGHAIITIVIIIKRNIVYLTTLFTLVTILLASYQ